MKFSTQKRRTSRERFDLRPNVISAFTVATQHGQPINFASAPIKTHIAPPFGERAGAVSKNERDDFFPKSRIIFKKKKKLYSFLSLGLVFLLVCFGWEKLGQSWMSCGETRSTNETTESYFTRLFLPTLVLPRRFERGRADVRRHDAECVPKIRPHFGTAHRARWV